MSYTPTPLTLALALPGRHETQFTFNILYGKCPLAMILRLNTINNVFCDDI